jgi:hypothetical protein
VRPKKLDKLLLNLETQPSEALDRRIAALITQATKQGRTQESSLLLTLIGLFRQPAVTFVLGIVIGCILVSAIRNGQTDLLLTVSPDKLLTMEHNKNTQIYKGKIIKELYPQFENPKIVVERAEETSAPHRVLHGTLDDGEIDVVWNL